MPLDRKPTVTLHSVPSLDGYIARNDNDVSWLEGPGDVYERGAVLSDADIEKALAGIDAYILGSRTYEHALQLGWPYGDKPTIVLTRRDLPVTRDSVELYDGELPALLEKLGERGLANVWLAGGAALGNSFLRLGLVDRIVLTIAPVTLGGGLRLFDDTIGERRWRLQDVVAYRNGFVQLTYEVDPASRES